MANELTLKLDTPIEQLIPAMIGFNNAELLKEVKARLSTYQGKIYDESSISDAKKDRATLNNFINALDSERKKVKKVYLEPLDRFTGEVNEVITAVEDVVVEIDTQVKSYEKKKKEEKHAECVEYFNSVIPEEIKEFVPYTKIHKEEWLNSSKSLSSVKKEIDAIIEKIKSELQTLETLGGDISELKYLYFENLNLAETITKHERKKAEKQRIQESMAKQVPNENKATQQEPKTTKEEKEYCVTFRVVGSAEKLNALSTFLQNNGYNYEKV